jgi:hypothetical protein
VTCTFTNTKKGHIIVRKVTVGGNGSFTFDTSYGPDFNLSKGQQNDSGPLVPGTYSVAETGIPADWDLTSAVCDDGSAPGAIDLAAGETVTCTFTNTLPPKLIVIKHVINDNGGTAVASDFTMTVTANNPNPASFPGVEALLLLSHDASAYAVNEAVRRVFRPLLVGVRRLIERADEYLHGH